MLRFIGRGIFGGLRLAPEDVIPFPVCTPDLSLVPEAVSTHPVTHPNIATTAGGSIE
jgi:hypothetical protein